MINSPTSARNSFRTAKLSDRPMSSSLKGEDKAEDLMATTVIQGKPRVKTSSYKNRVDTFLLYRLGYATTIKPKTAN